MKRNKSKIAKIIAVMIAAFMFSSPVTAFAYEDDIINSVNAGTATPADYGMTQEEYDSYVQAVENDAIKVTDVETGTVEYQGTNYQGNGERQAAVNTEAGDEGNTSNGTDEASVVTTETPSNKTDKNQQEEPELSEVTNEETETTASTDEEPQKERQLVNYDNKFNPLVVVIVVFAAVVVVTVTVCALLLTMKKNAKK